MSIIRVRRTGNFTVIPNEVINDTGLSGAELGLLVFLLSKPEDWQVSIAGLAKMKRFGALEKVSNDLKKLREKGYALMRRHGDGSVTWTITDGKNDFKPNSEMPNKADPGSEKQNEGKPHSENPNSGFPNQEPRSENPNSENPNSGFPNHTKERDKQNTERRDDLTPRTHACEFDTNRPSAFDRPMDAEREDEESDPLPTDPTMPRRCEIFRMLQSRGIIRVSPGREFMWHWVEWGVTNDELEDAVIRAMYGKKGEPISGDYLVPIIRQIVGERGLRKEKTPAAGKQKQGFSETKQVNYAGSERISRQDQGGHEDSGGPVIIGRIC
jgi:hypothetical protein